MCRYIHIGENRAYARKILHVYILDSSQAKHSSFPNQRLAPDLWRGLSLHMSNVPCAILFKWLHCGTNRHDEWLLLCPEQRVLFARRTKKGHRGYGSVGSWTSVGDSLVLSLDQLCLLRRSQFTQPRIP